MPTTTGTSQCLSVRQRGRVFSRVGANNVETARKQEDNCNSISIDDREILKLSGHHCQRTNYKYSYKTAAATTKNRECHLNFKKHVIEAWGAVKQHNNLLPLPSAAQTHVVAVVVPHYWLNDSLGGSTTQFSCVDIIDWVFSHSHTVLFNTVQLCNWLQRTRRKESKSATADDSGHVSDDTLAHCLSQHNNNLRFLSIEILKSLSNDIIHCVRHHKKSRHLLLFTTQTDSSLKWGEVTLGEDSRIINDIKCYCRYY